MTLGFSYVGLIILAMLFIPNGIWAKNKPKDYEKYSANENRVLLVFERAGNVLVTTLLLIFSDCNVRPGSWWIGWLILAFVFMVLYELYWIRYFRSPKTMADMYSSFAGFPVAVATLPVLAVFCIGIYAANIFLILSAVILGIGHIGIHLQHRREAVGDAEKKVGVLRVVKTVLLIPVILIVTAVTVIIAVRNFNYFRYSFDTSHGINESLYIDLNGQQQFITIRGEDINAPVILYLHGGPGAPDSVMAYRFESELVDEYTIVCWDQRGSGRTYFANDDRANDTVHFEQALDDLNDLVDYLSERFGQEKIIIMGHSYGSVLGSRYACIHPEKTAAFIGVGQFVSFLSSEQYEYEDLLMRVQEAGDDVEALTQAHLRYRTEFSLETNEEIAYFAEKYHTAPRERNIIFDILFSPTLSTEDVLWYSKQLNYDQFIQYSGRLVDYLFFTDLRQSQTSFEVPVFFISGDHDWNCAWSDMADYAQQLGVHYDLVEGCGHYVQNDDPVRFAEIVKADLGSIGL